MSFLDGSIEVSTLALLFLCLAIALGFEFVNGFHDTANAVATVIYTRSLKPWKAVVWSGFMNFLGVLFGGVAVAFSIVHLLPVDLLINIGKTAGLLMVLSLLLSAIIWNFGTWYFGLPSSSSHALIGSILPDRTALDRRFHSRSIDLFLIPGPPSFKTQRSRLPMMSG